MSVKKILASISRADYDYNLIEDGDKIAVGVSGGKDSMLLLKVLKAYQKFKTKKFLKNKIKFLSENSFKKFKKLLTKYFLRCIICFKI